MSNAQYQFQFQYGPAEWLAVRTANEHLQHSPATTISVWACGLAACLLILGAIGQWMVLTTIVVVSVLFLAVWVQRIQRGSLSAQESLVRTLTLTDSKLTESFGNSHFEKAWDAFDEFKETNDHFLFRHFEKVTLLPKRAIPGQQVDDCRRLIKEGIGQNRSETLPLFDDWFQPKSATQVYRFCWQDADIERLQSARMQPFKPAGTTGLLPVRIRSGRAARLAVVAGTVLIIGANFFPNRINGVVDWIGMLLFPIAISIPFAVAYLWWRYTTGLTRKRGSRFPRDEISVTQDESGILIGYPKAVARYGWQDISGLFISDHFIGFRPNRGLVHVIASHAFGGLNQATAFLLSAEMHRQRNQSESQETYSITSAPFETGNPFQPPGI